MNSNIGLISIIMAAFNAEKTISAAIQSVLNQTYTHFELIVVNDCSTDKTKEIILSFHDPRIKLFNNTRNSGVSLSRKEALEHAQGEWISIIDSDDIWRPDKLEKQIKFSLQNSIDFSFTGASFIDYEDKPFDWSLHVPPKITYKELLKQNLISNSSILIKTSLYKQFYVIGDKYHEDFALWLNILKQGYLAYGIDEPLLIYRLSRQSKTSNKYKSAIMNWNTYRLVGLNFFQSLYYMFFYFLNGIKKYHHFLK